MTRCIGELGDEERGRKVLLREKWTTGEESERVRIKINDHSVHVTHVWRRHSSHSECHLQMCVLDVDCKIKWKANKLPVCVCCVYICVMRINGVHSASVCIWVAAGLFLLVSLSEMKNNDWCLLSFLFWVTLWPTDPGSGQLEWSIMWFLSGLSRIAFIRHSTKIRRIKDHWPVVWLRLEGPWILLVFPHVSYWLNQ